MTQQPNKINSTDNWMLYASNDKSKIFSLERSLRIYNIGWQSKSNIVGQKGRWLTIEFNTQTGKVIHSFQENKI